MHLPPEPHGQLKSARFPQPVEDTLERIRRAAELAGDDWLQVLGLTEKQYLRLLIERVPLAARTVESVAARFGLSFESVMRGDVDYAALSAREKGDHDPLPARFSVGAFSRRRTSIHLLDYVELNHGWRTRSRILRHFQMSEALFKDPDQSININFVTELCEYLSKSGCSTDVMKSMGEHSFVANRKTPLGRLLRSYGTSRMLHEHVFTELISPYFDKNCIYQLVEISDHHCVVTARPSTEVQDELMQKVIGSTHVCSAKVGSFQSLSGYLGLPFSKVTETDCVHSGAGVCRFHFDFQGRAGLSRPGPHLASA
ncbi:MAG: hypothetical protein H7222_18160 [Methylotenera sp.]|nr:hypothetical protein [Oligoflexia bacterium]